MKPHSVALVPTDPDKNLKIVLKILAPDQKTAEQKALDYVQVHFFPLKYKLAVPNE